jgi:hypothetical protein
MSIAQALRASLRSKTVWLGIITAQPLSEK